MYPAETTRASAQEYRRTREERVRRKLVIGVIVIAALVVAAVIVRDRLNGNTGPKVLPGADWPAYLNGNSRTGYARDETVLTPETVSKLEPRWTVRGSSTISDQATVVGDRVYWGSWDGFEHATDVETGKELWRTYLGDETDRNCVPAHLGVASTAEIHSIRISGKPVPVLFVGGGDGGFYALKADSGAVLWSRNFGSPQKGVFIWSSPAVYGGSVYVGVGSIGDCPAVPGKLVKLNAATGATEATFTTVPRGCIGATVWTSPAIDETTGTVFITTGNAGDCARPEPLAEAMIALTTAHLSLVGAWRIPPKDNVPDGDYGGTPTLFTATIGGVRHRLVGAAGKNGFYYAFDRRNVAAGPVWKTARISFLPDTKAPSAWDGRHLYVAGHRTVIDGRKCEASIRAVDPTTGHFVWEDCLRGGAPNGALTAIPGVVFEGVGSVLYAVRSRDGRVLFSYHDTSFHWFYSPAAVARGSLYIGNSDGTFYSFSPDGE
jgi:polyvinyl alcohol dehydrogenase (cytochrome)